MEDWSKVGLGKQEASSSSLSLSLDSVFAVFAELEDQARKWLKRERGRGTTVERLVNAVKKREREGEGRGNFVRVKVGSDLPPPGGGGVN